MRNEYIVLMLSFLLISCNNTGKQTDKQRDRQETQSDNEYAKYFGIEQKEGYTIVTINETWSGNNNVSHLVLVEKGMETPSILPANAEVIHVPLEKVVCMSTSHLPYLTLLDQREALSAVSGARYISDSIIKTMVNKGEVQDIGYEASLNYEMLIRINPDLVFTYGISGENNQYIDKIRAAGIRVVVVGDYMEEHPLGKLEYLKFFGAFFGKSVISGEMYEQIKARYNEASKRTVGVTDKPVVLLNAPWKDVWYIPGDNNYMSHLIKDAGGVVLLGRKGDAHSYAHSLENVVSQAYKSDFWLNPNFYSSLEELGRSNPLFANLPVFGKGKVYNNTKRDTPGGGSDFWERGVVEPDVILNDLINILHPTLGNKKELVYYKLLE